MNEYSDTKRIIDKCGICKTPKKEYHACVLEILNKIAKLIPISINCDIFMKSYNCAIIRIVNVSFMIKYNVKLKEIQMIHGLFKKRRGDHPRKMSDCLQMINTPLSFENMRNMVKMLVQMCSLRLYSYKIDHMTNDALFCECQICQREDVRSFSCGMGYEGSVEVFYQKDQGTYDFLRVLLHEKLHFHNMFPCTLKFIDGCPCGEMFNIGSYESGIYSHDKDEYMYHNSNTVLKQITNHLKTHIYYPNLSVRHRCRACMGAWIPTAWDEKHHKLLHREYDTPKYCSILRAYDEEQLNGYRCKECCCAFLPNDTHICFQDIKNRITSIALGNHPDIGLDSSLNLLDRLLLNNILMLSFDHLLGPFFN